MPRLDWRPVRWSMVSVADLGAGKDFGFVYGFDDSALHQDFTVDDYGVDVLAAGEVGDPVHGHVEGVEVGACPCPEG